MRTTGLLLSGAVIGAASVVTHGRTLGLVLGLAATASATYALPGGWTTRVPFVGGWTAVLVVALLPRGGGGYLIGADPRGYTLLGVGVALMLFAIITVRPLRPPPPEPAP